MRISQIICRVRPLFQIANLKLDSELDPKDWIEPQDKILQSSPMLDKFLQTLKPHHYFEGDDDDEEAPAGGGKASAAANDDAGVNADTAAAASDDDHVGASGDDAASSASADDGSGGEEAPVAVTVTVASDKNNNNESAIDVNAGGSATALPESDKVAVAVEAVEAAAADR